MTSLSTLAPVLPEITGPDEDPTQFELYRFWHDEVVRFADLDPLGHVNNNAYGVYLESARVAFLQARGLNDDAGRTTVIVRLELDFRGEVHYPATVRIGLRTLQTGRSSFSFGYALFEGERCVATATTVLVRIDSKTHRPVALTALERERLEAAR